MAVNDVTDSGIAKLIVLAEATPRRFAAATAGLGETRLAEPPAPDAWSPLQILNHLRACEEVWMHSVQAMLAFDKPNLTEIHPRQWIKRRSPNTERSFAESLQIFTLQREALLITLRALSLENWAREGRIERKTHTVYSHVRRMVLHEDTHCTEIETMLAED